MESVINGVPFRKGLYKEDNGRVMLLGSRCVHCGFTFFPYQKLCPKCYQSAHIIDAIITGNGTLHTFTTVYRSLPSFKTPYKIGYVDYDKEGVRVFAQLEGDELSTGMEMEPFLDILRVGPDGTPVITYKFRPARRKGGA